jgi:tagatose-1,6-bisphosphate aldolase
MQALVREVAAQCDALDVALFLEVLTYSPEPDGKLAGDAKTEAVVGAARDLTPIGGDVYKAEFPVDVHSEPDEAVWAEGCAALSAASAIPWVLLSAGVDHETFVRQTRVACEAGASGILAGRSIWKEAVELEGDARAEFLHKTACKRTAELRAICVELGHPYTDFYAGDEPGVDWYRGYADL